MQKIYRIVLLCTTVVIVLSLLMLFRINKRLVLSIDGYDVRDTMVTVGRGSDICFDKVPERFLSVTRTSEGIKWEVNPSCVASDSLCYLKINDKNPNLHPLTDAQTIKVNVGRSSYSLPVSELDKLLEGHESQYVLLRNALEKHRREAGNSTFGDFREERGIRSFFYRDKDRWGRLLDWQIVILDNSTRVEGEGEPVKYATGGTVGDYCKVQFYRMAEYSFKSDDKDLFHIGEINYLAKPVLLTTQWGAGHAMLRAGDDVISVGFPKPLTYTEDCGVLRSLVKGHTTVITLQQDDASMPVGSNIYIPQFSDKVPLEVSHFVYSHDSLLIDGHDVRAKFSIAPKFDSFDVDKGNAVLHVHVGVIGKWFLLSYLWLPLFIFLVIFFAYPRLVSLQGIRTDTSYFSTYLPELFRMVSLIAFAYCVCKALIAIKLSWTYPYFEKLSGVSVANGGLILVLFFSLSLLFNRQFLTAKSEGRRRRGKRLSLWVAVLMAVAGLALCVATLRYSDRFFSRDVLASYMPGEVFSYNPFSWPKLNGINDLHRSIPYTLIFTNIVVIGLLVLYGIKQFLVSWLERLLPESWQKQWQKRPVWWQKLSQMAAKGGWVSALLTALFYSVAVLFSSMIPGNFATVFITFFVVIGVGRSLLKIDYSGNRIGAFVTSVIIISMFVFAAIIWPTADTGYFINSFGLAGLIIFLYIMVSKYERVAPTRKELEANRKERWWMNVLMAVTVFAMVVGIPWLFSFVYNPENVDYSRKTRRFMMFSQFNDYRDSGYRYAVSDTEFMTVMVHGMFNASGKDPLSPERHALHPSVSTGQSPVVLNDVSLPLAFFGTYGLGAYVVFFGLLALLLLAVVNYSIPSTRRMARGEPIGADTLWRLISVMMWVGSSLYLYMSYVGVCAFTGRLNAGLGTDSTGEALETAVLLAFMTATQLKQSETEQKQQVVESRL